MEVDPRFYGLHAFQSATEALASMLKPEPVETSAATQPDEAISSSLTPAVIADKPDLEQLLSGWQSKRGITKQKQPIAEVKQPTVEEKQPVAEVKQPAVEEKQTVAEVKQPAVEKISTPEPTEHVPSQFIGVDQSSDSHLSQLLSPWAKKVAGKETTLKTTELENVSKVEQPPQPEPLKINLGEKSSFQKNLLAALPVKVIENRDRERDEKAQEAGTSQWVPQPTLDVQKNVFVTLPESRKQEAQEEKPFTATSTAHTTIDIQPGVSNIYATLPIKAETSSQPQTDKPLSDNIIISTSEKPSQTDTAESENKNAESIDSILTAIKSEAERMLQKQDEARLSALRQDATLLAAFDDIAKNLRSTFTSTLEPEQLIIPQATTQTTDNNEVNDQKRLQDLLEQIEVKSYRYSTSFTAKELGDGENPVESETIVDEVYSTEQQEMQQENATPDDWDYIPIEPLGPGVARLLGDIVGEVVDTGMAASRIISKAKESEQKRLPPPT
ncbi:MAG: hypothetical protein HQL70_02055 [Magnetococcales bacterium]|nr:hypothetical protein [Magnetococcales bacterium]